MNKLAVRARNWRKNNKLRSRQHINSYQKRLRLKAIEALGGKCKCGFSDWRALQIDHINGGGNKERKNIGWAKLYNKIIAGTIKGYQLLCANCNFIKRHENKEFAYK